MNNISFLNILFYLAVLLSYSDIYQTWTKNNGLSVYAVPITDEVIFNENNEVQNNEEPENIEVVTEIEEQDEEVVVVEENEENNDTSNENEEDENNEENQEEVEVIDEEEEEQEEQEQQQEEDDEEEEEDFEFVLAASEDSNCSKKIVGYYADWRYSVLPPSKLPFDRLTHINYAFGVIDPNTFKITGYSSNILSELVKHAHQHGVKVLISVGGWSGSQYFTKMTSTKASMNEFVKNAFDTIRKFDLDGIDIDWEYPGRTGYNNNPDLANDTPNFLVLLKKLRKIFGNELLITAAVSSTPFEQNGRVLNNLSQFVSYFNFINVMAYDFSGSWSKLISHHQSFDTPEKGHNFSFKKSIDNWVSRGFPKGKIVVGVGLYGKTFVANSKINFGLFQTQNKNIMDKDNDSNSSWLNYCKQDELAYTSSFRYKYIYKYILSLSEINSKNEKRNDLLYTKPDQESNSIIQYDCWLRVWDNKAQAPYLFNTKFNNVISYDDPQSIKIKTRYILDNDYAGIMMWELDGDTEDWLLINTMNDILCQ